jgi:hypothetical protein
VGYCLWSGDSRRIPPRVIDPAYISAYPSHFAHNPVGPMPYPGNGPAGPYVHRPNVSLANDMYCTPKSSLSVTCYRLPHRSLNRARNSTQPCTLFPRTLMTLSRCRIALNSGLYSTSGASGNNRSLILDFGVHVGALGLCTYGMLPTPCRSAVQCALSRRNR